MENLPIESLRGDIYQTLRDGADKFVIAAPTASGKSTRLPHIFWKSGFVDGKIIVMQPRRVAARMLAKAVSNIFQLKSEVGWHVRFDKHYDENAKIVFVTEGILARMILADPNLKGVGAIIFDEFHERNIYADLSLGLALRAKKLHRPDLKIALCSASMDSSGLLNFLGESACKFECSGRLYPVDISYQAPKTRDIPMWESALAAFERLARAYDEGDFLIFMPGAYEISRTVGGLIENPLAKGFDIFALHGDLPPSEQDRILSPSNKRKIIVSTNIAETSLTIDGVRFVIDSGYAKVARYDTERGVNTLLLERVSLASAVQRAGRAGRTRSGIAIRLWKESDEVAFEQYTVPEIRRLDLSQIILWLKSSNLDIAALPLFEQPDSQSLNRAMKSLHELGALDKNGDITKIGKMMADFPSAPRSARILIEGAHLNCAYEAAMIAALEESGRIKLSLDNAFKEAERDTIAHSAKSEPEELIDLCLEAKRNSFSEKFCREYGIHGANARKVCSVADELFKLVKSRALKFEKTLSDENLSRSERIARCVLSGYSDCLGVRLNKGTLACRFVGARRGEIRKDSRAWANDCFVAMSMKEQNLARGVNIMASMIVPIEPAWLREIFPEDFSESSNVLYSTEHKRVVSKNFLSFRDLVLFDDVSYTVPPYESSKILRDEILSGRLELKNFDSSAKAFIERVNFVAKLCPESGIMPIDETALSEIYEQMCFGMSTYSDVKNADIHKALRDWLSKEQEAFLNYAAPRHIEMPRRKKPLELRYEAAAGRVVISSYFKDFFDFDVKKVRICEGKVKPICELLSPRGIAVQATQDLDNFWLTGWEAVKKDLKARYPKHF